MSRSGDSLFVAVWPPPDVVRSLEALPRAPLDGVRWERPEKWHVTLRFLGRTEAAPVVAALSGLEVGGLVRLGPTVGRLGRGVLCLPADGLDALASSVVAATADLGRPPEHRRFRGHLTLGRLREGVTVPLEGTAFDASFPVREVTVVASRGGEYEVLASVASRFGNA